MSLKDNFSQAVKEIINKDVKNNNDSKDQGKKTDLDRYLEHSSATSETKEQPVQQAPKTFAQEKTQDAYSTKNDNYTNSSRENQTQSSFAEARKPETNAQIDSPYHDVDEQTIISRNTIIEGNVRSFANITVEGSVKGDIQSTKNASISGKLVGDLNCNNASMAGSQMQGNITSKGQVKFDRDSLILDNIGAQYLEMNGKVKGNIDINGKAEFKSDAYIIGDINVSTLTVFEGATISGHVNTTFLQDTPSTVFPEMIAMTDIG